MYRCPVCDNQLYITESGAAACKNRHSFDKAGGGYHNLLLSKGGNHGDNKDMVMARRRFLATGAYLPLCNRVAGLCAQYTPMGGALLDAGCGEGYYTSRVAEALSEKGARIFGFDISKDAVRAAAKKRPDLHLAVASAYKMPYFDECFDTVINIFSPLAIDETRRVLRKGGKFIMAIPDVDHLWGLKAAIYDTPYKNRPSDEDPTGFRRIEKIPVHYRITLDTKEKINDLFMMTPYAYRTGTKERERINALSTLETEIEFIVIVYEKTEQ